MLETIWHKYLINVVDVLVVAFIIYRLLLFIKGTRAMQVLVGITFVALFTIVSESILKLPTLAWLMGKFWLASMLVLAVVFQPELRQALAKLGSHRFITHMFTIKIDFINEVISAVKEAMSKRMGMLIVLERDMGLRDFVETGTVMNADLTRELLLTLFQPPALLHDGAVIVVEGRVIAAGCVLPLSSSSDMAKVLGTRHRAALGLAEITDACVIVVSEETGRLSLARGGKLYHDLDPENLHRELVELYRASPARSLK